MSSIQERLQLKRVPLDKWSVKEKLCLSSCVNSSGENWMTVSRSLKMMFCESNNRPLDWFSQKCCAAQYGKLLENVETPKRKKRTASEREAVETPSESILRILTQERILELKKLINEEQQQYQKVKEEVNSVPTSEAHKLREIWNQIELEKKQKEKDKQQHTQWLKEREERKQELERAWRPGNLLNQQNSPSAQSQIIKNSNLTLKIKSEEIEVDEVSSKPGTSPLLTSLLKSPSPAPNTTANIVHTPTSARNIAPTITNLLTSPDLNLIEHSTTNQQILAHVIPVTSLKQPTSSQSAPTLSLLLETKPTIQTSVLIPKNDLPSIKYEENVESRHKEEKTAFQDLMESDDIQNDVNKDDEQQLMDVFNGLLPDNIDDLADILTDNNAIILSPELLEEEEAILNNVEASLLDQEPIQNEVKKSDNKLIERTPISLNSSLNLDNDISKPEAQNNVCDDNNDIESLQSDLQNFQEDEVLEKSPTPKIIIETSKPEDDLLLKLETIKNATTNEDTEKIENASEIMDEMKVSNDNNDVIKEKNDRNMKDNIEPAAVINIKEELDEIKQINVDDSLTTAKVVIEVNIKIEETLNDEELQEINDQTDKTNINKVINEETKNDDLEVKSNITTIKTETADELEIQKEETIDLDNIKDPQNEVNEKENEMEIIEDDKPNINSKNEAEIDCISSVSERKLSSDDDIYEDAKDDTAAYKELNEKQINEEEPQSISLIDTDDDSPIEVIKEDKIGKTKRDYSRKKCDYPLSEIISTSSTTSTANKKSDDILNDDKTNISVRMKLKERERSESPFIIDDDFNDSGIPRTRRRYSSTPNNIDSIPNSPASSEDRDYKTWKRAILIVYNRLLTHKYASIFLKQVTDEQVPSYKTVVLRSMDLQTIKRNIDNGITRNTADFQRDIMLMCHNAIIFNKKDTNISTIAKDMMLECITIIADSMDSLKRDEKPNKGRGGRKSSRVSAV